MIIQLIGTILITAVAITLVWQTFQSRRFGPFVPSNTKMLRLALRLLPLKPTDRFIDIGCGDGRAVILAAKKFNLIAAGIEIAPPLCYWARIRTILAGVRRKTKIIQGDLYQLNLSHYSIIYIFGLPENIQTRLNEKLLREVSAGTYVISYSFSLPHRQPIKTLADRWRKIMIYRF